MSIWKEAYITGIFAVSFRLGTVLNGLHRFSMSFLKLLYKERKMLDFNTLIPTPKEPLIEGQPTPGSISKGKGIALPYVN